jgi:hypothetical protein
VQSVYDRKEFKIDRFELMRLLDEMREKYENVNALFCDIVEVLLIVDWELRLTCEQVLEMMPPFGKIKESFGNVEKGVKGKKEVSKGSGGGKGGFSKSDLGKYGSGG